MRSFLDTNVLVYADDASEPARRDVAVTLVETHLRARTGVISTQVLQEFTSVALRKLGLPVEQVRARLALYRRLEVVPASADLISGALDLYVLHKLSFWDAAIVQAARQSGCAQLLTEDMAGGTTLAGVRVINPFRG